MKQFASNACGTIAAMHAILNADPSLIQEGSVFDKFLKDSKNLSYEERGNYFMKAEKLKEAHTEAV